MSLNTHSIGYQISGKDAGFSLITGLSALPYAKRHFELGSKTSGFVSFLHYTIGALECLPVGGFLIGLIDRIIGWAVSFFQSKAKHQMPRFEHFPDQTLQLISSYLPLKDQAHFALVFKKAHQVTEPLITRVKEGEKNFKKAIDIMLLDTFISIDEFGIAKFIETPASSTSISEERFKSLKQIISLIPNDMINCTSGYREDMNYKTVTLLSEAIECILLDEMCLEIVQMLFAKGASPLIETGFGFQEKSPLALAKERNFPELIALIQSKMSPC